MELGIYTFAETTPDPHTGRTISPRERLRDLLEEIELADQVGLDVFGVGEHHRPEFAVSAPAVVLAAAAQRTRRIRLTSAVSVLSSDDPVRVFQDFATLDLVSGGRAEIMAGRGSFIESFPLFGYDLDDYDALFAEKLELLLELREGRARHVGRPPPRGAARARRLSAAGAGSAARLGRRRRHARSRRSARARSGCRWRSRSSAARPSGSRASPSCTGAPRARRDTAEPALSINSHGFIADDSRAAADQAFPAFKVLMDRIGRERGWPPMTRAQFEASRTLHGANLVGDPDEVIEKILFQHSIFRHRRFLIQFSVGTLPHDALMRSIELFGTVVAPAVREAVGRSTAPEAA